MKTISLLPCLLIASLSAASAAEHLWDNFDTYPTGSIADQPGWSTAAWLTPQPGQVSDIGSDFSPHALELPWHADGTAAVFTNFSSTYDTNEHPVIRCSFRLRLNDTNTPFQIGLRNSAAGHFLKFMNTDSGYGQFGFQYHDVHFAPLATNSFFDVTFFYNRSNNTYRLDYFFTNRVPWVRADSDPVTHTQFNQFVAYRPGSGADTNSIFLDNVSVQTFPAHVWAWWRCDPIVSQEFVEQLGVFQRGGRLYTFDVGLPGSSDPVWDGTADYHNQGACRQLVATPATSLLTTPSSSNWTVEAAFRSPPDSGNLSFLDWGTTLGFNTNDAWISLGYNPNVTSIFLNVRDAQQPDADSQNIYLGPFRPTGRWQHIAVVKSNLNASLYVDYQWVTSRVFGARADGTYTFAPPSRATVGQSLNQGNHSGSNTVIDEVRISGKALALSEFLQPGPPLIVAIDNSPTDPPWELTGKCILGKTYHVETTPALAPAATWQAIAGSSFTSAHTFDSIRITNTAPPTAFIRIKRDD